jgi:hypothetical protein
LMPPQCRGGGAAGGGAGGAARRTVVPGGRGCAGGRARAVGRGGGAVRSRTARTAGGPAHPEHVRANHRDPAHAGQPRSYDLTDWDGGSTK